ncbi:MAG TPA: phosphatidate cytidylyltransferase [Spirochaetia bacterium]|nr:phosphatidate cytidylyltransferase [Spirochaetia bacterium]
MRNLIVRTILFLVAVPALIAIIIFLPQWHHLALNLIAVAASAIGASELARFFERRDAAYRASSFTIPLLGAALPLTQILIVNGILPQESIQLVIYVAASVILLLQILRREDEGFRYTLSNTAANLTLMLYPGFFLAYLVRISSFEHATVLILTFLCLVFFNDTAAYLSGMLYRSLREARARRSGRTWKPRFVLPVSPNKTLVGFAGGLATATATILVAQLLFPQQIPGSTLDLVLVGIAVGLATIFGDLIESALKRSATRKDSGSLIPGRGGILDSIDSVLYAAPVFYYLLRYLI